MQLKPKQNENKFKKGDVVCYKGDRSAIATVTMTSTRPLRYGAGKVTRTATLIWLTGPKLGTKQIYDIRDLVMVEEAT